MSRVERSSRQLSKGREAPEMGKRGRPPLCKGLAGALHLKSFQTKSAPKTVSGIAPNLVGVIRVTWRFRIAKFIRLKYPRWPS